MDFIKTVTLILLLISKLAFGQEFSYKDKGYDLEILDYINIETDSVSLETFLFNSKPFSKWDTRPLKDSQIWAFDTIYTSKQVSNFIWGVFSGKYELTQDAAMNKPNEFLNIAVNTENKLKDYFISNHEKFDELSNLILKSANTIYLNQNTIQRVDDIFRENNTYWSYSIPKVSPFPISNKIKLRKNVKFSMSQNNILNLMSNLNIYSVIKTKNGIFYLTDGFTDNSYGFYYSPKNSMELDNTLFNIMIYKKISNNYFYYVAH